MAQISPAEESAQTVAAVADTKVTEEASAEPSVEAEPSAEPSASPAKPDTLNHDDDLSLQYRWALWYSAPKSKDKEKKWDTERVKRVVEVGNVKEFWRVFNNLAPPSTLKDGSDLQLFRAGVSPAWEDPFNQKGGTWTYRVSADDSNQKLDTAWFNTVLMMIGDQFDDADDICGCVVSKRAQTNRLGLWIKHSDDRDAVKRIGKQLKDINRIKSRIYFYSHDDAKNFSKPNKASEMII